MSKVLALLMSFLLACVPIPPVAASEAVAPPPAPKVKASDAYDGIYQFRLWGSIGKGSGMRFLQAFVKAQAEEPDIIVVELNTTGGDVDEGFQIAKAIEDSAVPVICIVDYEALSMGFYILQSCPRRLMTTRSRLMVHDPGLMLPAQRLTPADAKAYLAQLESLRVGMNHHWSKHLKMDLKTFERKMRAKGDWYMTAAQAKELGAVDDTIDSSKTFVEGLKRAHRLRKALANPTPLPQP